MKSISPYILFAVFIALIQSCTIEKRLYKDGFHVEWKKRFKGVNSGVSKKSEVMLEKNEEEFPPEKAILNVPEQDSVSEPATYEGKGLEEKSQFIKLREEHPVSFSKQTKVEKASLKPQKFQNMNRGGFLGTVLVLLLIITILPLFLLVIFIAGEYLELILLGLIIVLVAALIIFFIVRMILTAVRY